MLLNRSRLARWTLLAAVTVLAGCASNTRLEPPAPVEDRMGGGKGGAGGLSSGSGVGAGQVSESRVATVDTSKPRDGAAGLDGAGRTVYFDYDSYAVKDDYRSVIETNAKLLNANAQRKMQVEGHTDARGGSEYNLALGQRRAEAVVKALKLLGARDNQLEAVSFGKERPAAQGNDEAAFAKNRRAELRDR